MYQREETYWHPLYCMREEVIMLANLTADTIGWCLITEMIILSECDISEVVCYLYCLSDTCYLFCLNVFVWWVEVSGGRFESVSGRLSELVNKDVTVDIRLERIPLVHRATTVFCDSRAANFAVLQSHPNSWSFSLFVVVQIYYVHSLDDLNYLTRNVGYFWWQTLFFEQLWRATTLEGQELGKMRKEWSDFEPPSPIIFLFRVKNMVWCLHQNWVRIATIGEVTDRRERCRWTAVIL